MSRPIWFWVKTLYNIHPRTTSFHWGLPEGAYWPRHAPSGSHQWKHESEGGCCITFLPWMKWACLSPQTIKMVVICPRIIQTNIIVKYIIKKYSYPFNIFHSLVYMISRTQLFRRSDEWNTCQTLKIDIEFVTGISKNFLSLKNNKTNIHIKRGHVHQKWPHLKSIFFKDVKMHFKWYKKI